MKGIKLKSNELTKLYALPECIQWKFELGKEKEEQLLIASCLTFMGINIATDKILFGCKVRQQWNRIL